MGRRFLSSMADRSPRGMEAVAQRLVMSSSGRRSIEVRRVVPVVNEVLFAHGENLLRGSGSRARGQGPRAGSRSSSDGQPLTHPGPLALGP